MTIFNNTTKGAAPGAFTPTSAYIATTGDTLVYVPSSGQELLMYNETASPVVVTIDGAAGTTVTVPGAGGLTASIAAGLAITVAAHSFSVVLLDKIPAYCNGVVAISAASASAVTACILQ